MVCETNPSLREDGLILHGADTNNINFHAMPTLADHDCLRLNAVTEAGLLLCVGIHTPFMGSLAGPIHGFAQLSS